MRTNFRNLINVEGKVVLITGAGRGIGAESARIFASQGALVVVADINFEAANTVVEDIRAKGWRATAVELDVMDYEKTKKVAEVVKGTFGSIDVLINNAGITADKTFRKMTPEMWHRVIDVNLHGVFNMTHAVVPYMLEQGTGRIINTSSIVRDGAFGQANYATTKSGLIGFTKTLAMELGGKGITVNAVAPGYIMTEMTAAMPEHVLDSMKEKVPMKRLGKPREIALAYLYLASDMAEYVNGTVIDVNGGMK